MEFPDTIEILPGRFYRAVFSDSSVGFVYKNTEGENFAVIPHTLSESAHTHCGPANTIRHVIDELEVDLEIEQALHNLAESYRSANLLAHTISDLLGVKQCCSQKTKASYFGKELSELPIEKT